MSAKTFCPEFPGVKKQLCGGGFWEELLYLNGGGYSHDKGHQVIHLVS